MPHQSMSIPPIPTSEIPPPTDRRQRRSAEIRERLFRAALTIFAEKGFTETTVEDIILKGAVAVPPAARKLVTTLNKKSPKNTSDPNSLKE